MKKHKDQELVAAVPSGSGQMIGHSPIPKKGVITMAKKAGKKKKDDKKKKKGGKKEKKEE